MIRKSNARDALRHLFFKGAASRSWATLFCAVAQVALFSAPLVAAQAQDDSPSTGTESSMTSSVAEWFQGLDLGNLLKWGGAFLAVVIAGWWLGNIYASFARRRKYEEPQIDDQPSVDERLLSELAPMEVALLRGSIDGFYEKVHSLMYQILRSRKLIDGPQRPTAEVAECLRDIGVEPTFLDCVESLATRCDRVRLDEEKPSQEDNLAIIKDLDTLIRMRPHATGRRRDRKRDKASTERNRPVLSRSAESAEETREQNESPTGQG